MRNETATRRPTPVKALSSVHAKHFVLIALAMLIKTSNAQAIYRCGEAYSSIPQCPHGAAIEVDTVKGRLSVIASHPTTAAQDLHEAQVLEKQRRLLERQALERQTLQMPPVQSMPLSAASEPTTNSAMPPKSRKGKSARKASPAYFTATSPTADPKKKGATKTAGAERTP